MAAAAPGNSRELDPDEHLWCPRWYPRSPNEVPCNHFMEWGRYLTYVGADAQPVEFTSEEPELFARTDHDCEQIDRVSAAEWERRLLAARRLGRKRGWKQPSPSTPDIAGAAGDRIVGYREMHCGACNRYGSGDRGQVLLVEVDTPAGPRRKYICAELRHDGYAADPARRAADRAASSHVNDVLDYWPPNF